MSHQFGKGIGEVLSVVTRDTKKSSLMLVGIGTFPKSISFFCMHQRSSDIHSLFPRRSQKRIHPKEVTRDRNKGYLFPNDHR